MEALEFIKSRRSTRKFADTPLEREKIDTVLEAGRFAPSGGNSQTTHFMVITDRSVLEHLSELAVQEFSQMEIAEDTYRSLANSIRASKKGGYVFYYNAPCLIITANKKTYGNSMADCACALENMMLMANALDLGSCWINQLKWLTENPPVLDYLRELGMEEDELVYGAVAIGYPGSESGLPVREPAARHGNPVTYIE